MRRREFVKAAGVLPLVGCVPATLAAPSASALRPGAAFRHSVTRWPYAGMSLDALCAMAADLGVASVELVQPSDAGTLARHGLTCAMTAHPDDAPDALRKGWNRAEHHAWLVPAYRRQLETTAAAGFPNLIVFSGNREGLSDEAGLDTMAAGLAQVLPDAERLGVTLCLELFNSKVDHPDYQADSTAWGVELVRRVGSPRFRLLYDIYHMQIMEGDVIRTVTDHLGSIAHFHTAGVPGRHEIDETQELFYPAIMRAIAATGFAGYVGQEFIPTGDPRATLADALARCTV